MPNSLMNFKKTKTSLFCALYPIEQPLYPGTLDIPDTDCYIIIR